MSSIRVIHLNVSEMAVSESPAVLSTVLGSCVSVCLYCPEKKAGGMIHFALPSTDYAQGENEPLRFGDQAIEILVNELKKITKLSPSRFVAKITGGAAVVDHLKQSSQIGALNIAMAEDTLRRMRIRIVGSDAGGLVGRKVVFYTETGRLRVAPLRDTREGPTPFDPPSLKLPEKKRVLIIDDSRTICELLKKTLSQDPELEVVGTAPNPSDALELVQRLKPDVITLDIHMPVMNGIEFLETLYPKIRVPVVMITSISKEESNAVFRALELGAVDYIQKPKLEELREIGPIICEKVKVAASTRVRIRKPSCDRPQTARPERGRALNNSNTLIAIGASTGGTEALKAVLTKLPKDMPPILVVQHIPPVFSAAFANRLNDLCEFEVKEAQDGDPVKPGRALIAPGGLHMRFRRSASKGDYVTLEQSPPVQRHRPSVDVMFQSVAREFGGKAIGIILTGMGSDGAQGMLEMKRKGSKTIAQDEESCVVFGMPREAIRAGAVDIVCSLDEVPERLLALLEARKTA